MARKSGSAVDTIRHWRLLLVAFFTGALALTSTDTQERGKRASAGSTGTHCIGSVNLVEWLS